MASARARRATLPRSPERGDAVHAPARAARRPARVREAAQNAARIDVINSIAINKNIAVQDQ
jgi:hypothetical protein